jgi:predicted RNA-binding Zn ribbon-like protein
MYEDIKRMLAAAYELEGLLMLADSRGDDTPEMVVTAIREKIENLAKAAEGLNFSACENTPEPTADMPSENADGPSPLNELDTDNAEETTEAPLTQEEAEALISAYHDAVDTQTTGEECESSDTEQQPEFDMEDETTEMAVAMHEYLDNLPQTEETPETDATEQPEESAAEEPETPVEEEPTEEEPVEEIPAAEEPTTEEETLPETDDTQEEAKDDTPEETENSADKEPAVPEDDNTPTERITIDEAFIRNKSKDLRSAFSINDSFRFRRELFGNSAAEMADAINLAEAMQTFDEAEEYFYGDLGWDKDSEEVKEFMTIIRNHFL